MTKKTNLIYLLLLIFSLTMNAQITTIDGNYKVIDIGTNGVGDYARSLILLHEMYNGSLVGINNAVGTITAFRGSQASFNRINIVQINSSSAYDGTFGTIHSYDNNANWNLKTCIYNNKKYLAIEVPYAAAYHDWSLKFAGWTISTGENMKSIVYEIRGVPQNTNILSNIENYNPNMDETHQVNNFLILGNNVGIGTKNPDAKLTVAGNIHAQEVKVTTTAGAVPDYVFANDYKLKSLEEVESFIKENSHLPEIPSAKEIEKNGLMLAEMNMNLLKKIEEMTLYMIEVNKKLEIQNLEIQLLKKKNEDKTLKH
jgi:hypothetical protein